MILACDQVKNRIVMYDTEKMDGNSIDTAECFEYIPNNNGNINISGVKYRENTVFGDVLIICSSGGYAGVVTYPGKQTVWENDFCGNNPHSIELLPNGDVACAASTGSSVRIYHTQENRTNEPECGYTEFSFNDAHGLLYEPSENLLWVLGMETLAAYSVTVSGSKSVLGKRPVKRYALPCRFGHDLSADLHDSRFMWITTSERIYHFDKQNGTFSTDYDNFDMLSKPFGKGFGNTADGRRFYVCSPNGCKTKPFCNEQFAPWCTDTIFEYEQNGGSMTEKALVSDKSAFYKVVVFNGSYL